MALDLDAVLGWDFPDVTQSYTTRDAILYALSVGLGQDPLDERQLDFVYETRLRAFPSIAVVLGYPGFWLKNLDTGVDWKRLVHGEQAITWHAPLPADGEMIGRTRVTGLVDRGAGKGALLYSAREVVDAATGTLLATLDQSTVLRGDGGFGHDADGVLRPRRPGAGALAGA